MTLFSEFDLYVLISKTWKILQIHNISFILRNFLFFDCKFTVFQFFWKLFQLEQCTQLLFCSVSADSSIALDKVNWNMRRNNNDDIFNPYFKSRMLTIWGGLWPGSRENTKMLTSLENSGIDNKEIDWRWLNVKYFSADLSNVWQPMTAQSAQKILWLL